MNATSVDPLRPRDWRWLRAQETCRYPARHSAHDDEITTRATGYLRRYIRAAGCTTNIPTVYGTAIQKLQSQWPDIASAHRIYMQASFARWAMEAMVLAEVSDVDIAADLGCDVLVVRAYEALFYDVRDRMKNRLFILDELMSPALMSGASGISHDYDFMWKGLAYMGGMSLLRGLWSLGITDTESSDQLQALGSSAQLRNVVKAQLLRAVNSKSAHDVIDEALTKQQLDDAAKKDMPEGKDDGASQLIAAMQFSMAEAVGMRGLSPIEPRAGASIMERLLPLAGIPPPALPAKAVEAEVIDAAPVAALKEDAAPKATDPATEPKVEIETPLADRLMTKSKQLPGENSVLALPADMAQQRAERLAALAQKKELILSKIRGTKHGV